MVAANLKITVFEGSGPHLAMRRNTEGHTRPSDQYASLSPDPSERARGVTSSAISAAVISRTPTAVSPRSVSVTRVTRAEETTGAAPIRGMPHSHEPAYLDEGRVSRSDEKNDVVRSAPGRAARDTPMRAGTERTEPAVGPWMPIGPRWQRGNAGQQHRLVPTTKELLETHSPNLPTADTKPIPPAISETERATGDDAEAGGFTSRVRSTEPLVAEPMHSSPQPVGHNALRSANRCGYLSVAARAPHPRPPPTRRGHRFRQRNAEYACPASRQLRILQASNKYFPPVEEEEVRSMPATR